VKKRPASFFREYIILFKLEVCASPNVTASGWERAGRYKEKERMEKEKDKHAYLNQKAQLGQLHHALARRGSIL